MRKATISVARVAIGTMSVLGFATVISTGTAQAAPQDCTITRDLIGARATCHDNDFPPGREYSLVVECWGLHPVPMAWPLLTIGPYQGSWSGSFAPNGQGSASCLDGLSVGTATNAYVKIYRD